MELASLRTSGLPVVCLPVVGVVLSAAIVVVVSSVVAVGVVSESLVSTADDEVATAKQHQKPTVHNDILYMKIITTDSALFLLSVCPKSSKHLRCMLSCCPGDTISLSCVA